MQPSMSAAALRRILVVEHRPNTRSLVGYCLGKLYGYDVITCASGDEALERAAGFAPDLILLDVGMPGIDGMETLARLRAASVAAPVVFFTSRQAPSDRARYVKAGALGTIAKPFDPLKLARQLSRLWDGRTKGRKAVA
jgi:two-component system OmpR family response regulator